MDLCESSDKSKCSSSSGLNENTVNYSWRPVPDQLLAFGHEKQND